jgi:NAD(P)-dependent dehydrogenase (short-subunit alcohol dehydrogenase family)
MKTVLITGATSGIGFELFKIFSNEKYKVIGIGRNKKRIKKTLNSINKNSKNLHGLYLCNFENLEDIKKVFNKISKEVNSIDILINNAGGIFVNNKLTNNNIERTFQVNYLSHFLLTDILLKNKILKSKAHVLNVSSIVHKRGEINLDDINNLQNYNAVKSYAQSKVSQIMWGYYLSEKHKEIYINSVHPGIIGTRLLSNNGFISPILVFFHKIYGKNAKYGAKNVFEVLKHVLKNDINGKYFNERNEEKSSDYSYNKIIQEKLLQISKKLVKDNLK